jgi:hypothetical protein
MRRRLIVNGRYGNDSLADTMAEARKPTTWLGEHFLRREFTIEVFAGAISAGCSAGPSSTRVTLQPSTPHI